MISYNIWNSLSLHLRSLSISRRLFPGGLKTICSSKSTCSENYLRVHWTEVNNLQTVAVEAKLWFDQRRGMTAQQQHMQPHYIHKQLVTNKQPFTEYARESTVYRKSDLDYWQTVSYEMFNEDKDKPMLHLHILVSRNQHFIEVLGCTVHDKMRNHLQCSAVQVQLTWEKAHHCQISLEKSSTLLRTSLTFQHLPLLAYISEQNILTGQHSTVYKIYKCFTGQHIRYSV